MPTPTRTLRGAVLNPTAGGSADYWADGVVAVDGRGVVAFAGPGAAWDAVAPADAPPAERFGGVLIPPMLDAHTHVPQWPIRGDFLKGVADDGGPSGRLLAGLKRNVFPTEQSWSDADHAAEVARKFAADALANGVVGGASYATVHPAAARAALRVLPDAWSVGLVLMNQNCPDGLRTDVEALAQDVASLAAEFGPRLIVTDRFAVAVSTPLRRLGADLAGRHGLRTQTHLDEQLAEKAFVETALYPDAPSYAGVYRRDGLFDHRCILAHCVWTSREEWSMLADTGSSVAHCPTSNALLGSGVMSLAAADGAGVPWAIATDVGASPTCSMLAEMAAFCTVHAGGPDAARATPSAALWRATLAPAAVLGLSDRFGRLEEGRPASFVEVEWSGDTPPPPGASADGAIAHLLGLPASPPRDVADAVDELRTGRPSDAAIAVLDADVRAAASRLEDRVRRVVIGGATVLPPPPPGEGQPRSGRVRASGG